MLPKINVDARGIGLIKVMWKVVETFIDTWVNTDIQFHDVLHGFRTRRVTGTSTMELKMAQELASIDQDPFLLVFLYISRANDTLDC